MTDYFHAAQTLTYAPTPGPQSLDIHSGLHTIEGAPGQSGLLIVVRTPRPATLPLTTAPATATAHIVLTHADAIQLIRHILDAIDHNTTHPPTP